MAGVSVDGAKRGGRKSLDSEINMIPMIDLLMVTVSFLLITAVWSNAQRMEATAQVAGHPLDTPPCESDCDEEAKLHVHAGDPAKFVLAWKQAGAVVRTVDVPRDAKRRTDGVAFPALAETVSGEWRASGRHRAPTDLQFDRAVVHVPNDMPYSELIAVMDAVAQPKRELSRGGALTPRSAFDVTFAAD